jgi:hypothetical protein
MAQAVSRRPLTMQARVSACGICGGQIFNGTGSPPPPQVLRFSPVNFIPPVLHYFEKRKILIIFITGLHNKPQGCGASVASAAGPFTTNKLNIIVSSNTQLLSTQVLGSNLIVSQMLSWLYSFYRHNVWFCNSVVITKKSININL